MRRFRLGSVCSVLLASAIFLAACGGAAPVKLAPDGDLPAFLAAAAPRVRDAYRFAMANPHALETVPCYCGCGSMGHDSNLACFVQETDSGGNVTAFDQHANGCGICVDIAQDVMRLSAEGKQPRVIRQYVDMRYSSFGPATDTPLP